METSAQRREAAVQSGSLGNEPQPDEAYARVKPDLDALPAEDLLHVNLDVTAAITSVMSLLPKIRAHREQIAIHLPTFDISSFDKLEDYVLALNFTNTSYLLVTQPAPDLRELNSKATKLHDRMLADAKALAQHGLLNGAHLAHLAGGNGYKNLAQDLQLLSCAMRRDWDQIANKCATTADDLDTANQLSVRLMHIVGLREQGPARLAAATDQRVRAFTQFINVYEDARRAITYLRGRHGDAHTIAPSLYPGRPRKRAAQAEPAPVATEPRAARTRH